jgi:hypothetical protein
MAGAIRSRRRLWLLLAIAIVAGGAAVAYAVTRSSDQPEVSAEVLPVVSPAHETNVYVDCSKINSVAYFPDNPCQTFLLVQSDHFGSASELLTAESRQLSRSGWRHSSLQLVDYDGVTGGMATLSQSWVSPDHRACAYVTTDRVGVAAEGRELFPYDQYNQPHGVLDFYRTAKAANPSQTLWVRLRPPNRGGRCIG